MDDLADTKVNSERTCDIEGHVAVEVSQDLPGTTCRSISWRTLMQRVSIILD